MAVISVGDVFTTNQGSRCTVVAYKRHNDITVLFDTGNKKRVAAGELRSGSIKNPLHPTVYGVGFTGIGPHKISESRKLTPAYSRWIRMIQRACDGNYQAKNRVYAGCSVDARWLNFQVFADWYHAYPYRHESWQLDKDLIVQGNKVYSPEACSFVPVELNALMTGYNPKKDHLPIGVTLSGGKYRAQIKINKADHHIGLFDSPDDARRAYAVEKKRRVIELLNKYEILLDPRVTRSLKSWSFQ